MCVLVSPGQCSSDFYCWFRCMQQEAMTDVSYLKKSVPDFLQKYKILANYTLC